MNTDLLAIDATTRKGGANGDLRILLQDLQRLKTAATRRSEVFASNIQVVCTAHSSLNPNQRKRDSASSDLSDAFQQNLLFIAKRNEFCMFEDRLDKT